MSIVNSRAALTWQQAALVSAGFLSLAIVISAWLLRPSEPARYSYETLRMNDMYLPVLVDGHTGEVREIERTQRGFAMKPPMEFTP